LRRYQWLMRSNIEGRVSVYLIFSSRKTDSPLP
jgi:hypothetical protein